MADYIYLLDNRLSQAQRDALQQVRETARRHGMTVFLVGGAVRDLTSGAPIRDLNFAIQGDARQLADELGQNGTLLGQNDLMQALYYSFPGGVRLEISSTVSVTYPKPGQPVVQSASVLDDLRGRDFTANAMAISLNEGSYGLLMDPANGVADVENRELRLLSNYGFLEDSSRMIRATRLAARLGWQLEERTQTRYDNAKGEAERPALGDWERRYETEAIFREEDPLRVMRKLEAEGWMPQLSSLLISAKVDEGELDRLRDLVGQLNALSIFPDTSSAVFPLLTAKLNGSQQGQLKQAFALSGFAGQIDALDGAAKALATEFTARANAAPSAGWKLLKAAEPQAVLWMAYTAKSGPVQNRLKAFFHEWPQAQQKIPYQQMQEMRITPDLPGYDALLDDLFFASMDGKLDSPEAIKAFLEPFSPPAAPPPPVLRRRAVKRESKTAKSRAKKTVAPEPVSAEAASSAGMDAEAQAPAVSEPAPPPPAVPVPKANAPLPTATKAADSAPKVTSVPAKAAPGEKPPAKATPMKTESAKAPVKQAAPEPVKAKPAAKAPVKESGKKAVAGAKTSGVAAKAAPKANTAAKAKTVAKSAAKTSSQGVQKNQAAKKPSPAVKVSAKAKAAPAPAKRSAVTKGKAPTKTKSAPAAKKGTKQPGKAVSKSAAKAKRR